MSCEYLEMIHHGLEEQYEIFPWDLGIFDLDDLGRESRFGIGGEVRGER